MVDLARRYEGATELGRIHVERILAKDCEGKPPPYDLRAEAAVIGAIIVEPDAVLKVRDFLEDDGSNFYSDANKKLYASAIELYLADAKINIVTLLAKLRMRGWLGVGDTAITPKYITLIIDNTPSVAHVQSYAQLVKVYSQGRLVLAEAHLVRAELYSGDVQMHDFLQGVPERFARHVRTIERKTISIGEVLEEEQRKATAGEKLTPLKTGLSDFDAVTTGLHPGEWSLLGARTSDGKSTFAMTLAHNIAQQVTYRARPDKTLEERFENGVLIVSTESGMTPEVYSNRMAAMRGGLDLERFRSNKALAQEHADLMIAKEELRHLPIYYEPKDKRMSQAKLQGSILQLVQWLRRRGCNLRLIVLDLISGIDPRGENLPRNANDEQKLRYLAEWLDALMTLKELSDTTSVIATTQIDAKEEYPKGCKALGEVAPLYMVLRRNKPTKEDVEQRRQPMEIYLSKNRHGTRHVKAYQYFYEKGAYFAD